MKRLIWSAAVALLLFAVPAQAQNTLGGKVVTTCGTPGAFPSAGRAGPFTVDITGTLCTSAGGGGGGDATAANQALQITQETAINTILGTVAVSPTANTIADRLKVINTTLGTPFQAGGSIGNTTFAVTNAGTFAVQAAQATAANLNATVVGTGTFATQATIADGADVAQGAIGDTAYAGSGNATVVAALKGIYASVNGAIPAGTAVIGKVDQTSQYPSGATPYTATATGTTGATTATLTGAMSVTTYICGFSIRANATAAATGNATVTGTITGTLNFTQWTAPNASGLGIAEMIFTPCVPASATNTSVAVVSAAPGTGGVVSVTAWGYKL